MICRVVDQQRKFHFIKGFLKEGSSTRFLPKELQKSHKYKEISTGLFSSAKDLKDMLPKQFKGDFQGFTNHLLTKFKEFMAL